MQGALKNEPELGSLPNALDFIKNDADRKVMELHFTQKTAARPLVTPPEVPAERVALLRKAFETLAQDKEFLAEMDKAKMEFDFVPGPGDRQDRGADRRDAAGDRRALRQGVFARRASSAIEPPSRFAKSPRSAAAGTAERRCEHCAMLQSQRAPSNTVRRRLDAMNVGISAIAALVAALAAHRLAAAAATRRRRHGGGGTAVAAAARMAWAAVDAASAAAGMSRGSVAGWRGMQLGRLASDSARICRQRSLRATGGHRGYGGFGAGFATVR